MYKLKRFETYGKLTASALIERAEIVKTQSCDYMIRVANTDYNLDLTDDYDLCVSDFGTGLCVMTLTDGEIKVMEELQAKCEQKYAEANLETL